jgi:hypothetical protein
VIDLLRDIKPAHRRYLYRVANAGLALAVGYGVLNGEESALWLLAINAVLGLADANVPSQEA